MKYFLTSFLFILLITLLFSTSFVHSENKGVEKCLTCHDKTYNQGMMKSYLHQPFIKKKCLTCHIKGNDSASPKSGMKKSSQRRKVKINWLQKHYQQEKSHFFLFPSDSIYEKLFIQFKGKDQKSKVLSITIPPIDKVPQLNNDGSKPLISEIKFNGIKRGVLYSATISWNTDKPSTAQIFYGIGDFNTKSNLDTQLKKHHTLTLSPIVSGKTYDYTVVATDVHGNRTISSPMTFSADTVAMPLSKSESSTLNQPAKEPLKYEIRAMGDLYFVTITSNQPTYMGIGKNDDLRPRITIQVKNKDQDSKPVSHVPLTNTREANIKSCLKCHTEYQTESSHPIDVGPKPGMTFPDDYPLFDDGRMHCMTCHDAHSSANEARIRRPTKQKLCIACHSSYG